MKLGKPTFQIEVRGESCWPYLVPGKKYAVSKKRRPHVGDFVVFNPPSSLDETHLLVKKVAQIDKESLTLVGTVSWAAKYVVPVKKMVGVVLNS